MSVAPDDLTFLQKIGGFTGPGGGLQKALEPFGGAGNLGLALLANSGYSSTPRTIGQTLGVSALQAQQLAVQQQQLKAERDMEELRKRYMEAQIAAMQGKPEGFTLSPGQVRYDASGREMASVKAPEDLASEIREYQQGKDLGLIPKDTPFMEYQKRKRAAGATTINLGAQGLSAPPTGYARPDPLKPGLIIEPGGPADPKNRLATPPTEGERTAANYHGRMQEAEKLIGDFKPTTGDYIAALNMMEGGPIRSGAANVMMSQEGQKFYQAAADWVRAKLRKESGAVISPEEMAQEIKTYFPMPGDSDAVIRQKKRARDQATKGMREMGGRAVVSPGAPDSPVADPNADPLGILTR
jgi:hypothetical protein